MTRPSVMGLMMTNDLSTLEAVGEETAGIVSKGAEAILSEITFPNVLRELDLLPSLGWRHLVLNLVTEEGRDRIDDGARWIYAERLVGSIAGANPRELILVAFGSYKTRDGAPKEDLRVQPFIDGCAALEGGSVELLKAVGFSNGVVGVPVAMENFEFASKLRHARSQLGNPVIYRKLRKPNEKEGAI